MGYLYYVGAPSESGRDVERQISGETVLQSGVSRSWVTGEVSMLATSYATKIYVDNQDSLSATNTYYSAGDALLVPKNTIGQPGGVASLDATGKIPRAQVPVLGAGILRGPYGYKNEANGTTTTTNTPVRIADVFSGISTVTGFLLAFMQVAVQSDGGRPVIEIKAGDNTQTGYDDQTLIAAGRGRDYYNSYQIINVVPVTHITGMNQAGFWPVGTNLLVQAWMFDADGAEVEYSTQRIYSSALFFARSQQ